MAEREIEELAEAIIKRLKEEHHTVWLDPETHASQHEFLKMLMDERGDRIARRKRIEERIAGSLILSLMLVVIGFIGAGVMTWLRKNL